MTSDTKVEVDVDAEVDADVVARLAADLTALGVREGDVLMVHASLRKLGVRAAAIIAAIDRAVGALAPSARGTWLMILGSEDDGTPFDALTTPSLGEVGTLAEIVRTTAGTRVSDHPEARFAARGADADALVRDVAWDDYYGAGSPLERLVARGGRILRMGATPYTTTALHYAEWLAPLPGKRRVVRERDVRVGDAVVRRRVSTVDDEDGIVDWPGEDYFATILHDYLAGALADGRARAGRVGAADDCVLVDAADLVRFGVAWMTERFAPLIG